MRICCLRYYRHTPSIWCIFKILVVYAPSFQNTALFKRFNVHAWVPYSIEWTPSHIRMTWTFSVAILPKQIYQMLIVQEYYNIQAIYPRIYYQFCLDNREIWREPLSLIVRALGGNDVDRFQDTSTLSDVGSRLPWFITRDDVLSQNPPTNPGFFIKIRMYIFRIDALNIWQAACWFWEYRFICHHLVLFTSASAGKECIQSCNTFPSDFKLHRRR